MTRTTTTTDDKDVKMCVSLVSSSDHSHRSFVRSFVRSIVCDKFSLLFSSRLSILFSFFLCTRTEHLSLPLLSEDDEDKPAAFDEGKDLSFDTITTLVDCRSREENMCFSCVFLSYCLGSVQISRLKRLVTSTMNLIGMSLLYPNVDLHE